MVDPMTPFIGPRKEGSGRAAVSGHFECTVSMVLGNKSAPRGRGNGGGGTERGSGGGAGAQEVAMMVLLLEGDKNGEWVEQAERPGSEPCGWVDLRKENEKEKENRKWIGLRGRIRPKIVGLPKKWKKGF
jgi:hypothetical protein